MINLLIISALLYLIWVLLYLQRKRIKKFIFHESSLPPSITPFEKDDNDIMGKTKTQMFQVVTNVDLPAKIEKPIEKPTSVAALNENKRSAVVDNSELDLVFSDSPEPMDLDVEIEFNEEELLEEEDLICFLDNETVEPATGIPYDEMENLIQVMQQSQTSQEAEFTSIKTILQMDQTDLFQLMVSQID